jgi:hypothetical protein
MLPVKPNFHSATPMMVFTGQRHQGVLMSHIQATGPVFFDSLLIVHETYQQEDCLVVALESEGPGQPLGLALYGERGRNRLPQKEHMEVSRKNFLSCALFIVEQILHDRLLMPTAPQGKPAIEEKPLREFYPDAARRLKLHYYFAHPGDKSNLQAIC